MPKADKAYKLKIMQTTVQLWKKKNRRWQDNPRSWFQWIPSGLEIKSLFSILMGEQLVSHYRCLYVLLYMLIFQHTTVNKYINKKLAKHREASKYF